jgi:hypothetical protein
MPQTKEQAQDLSIRARRAFDIASLKLPRNDFIRAALNQVRSKLGLGPGASPYYLHNAAAFLGCYGHEHRLLAGAVVLGEVDPAQWRIGYEPIRQLIHTAAYFAHRAGDAQGLRLLEPLLFRERDANGDPKGRPSEEFLSGAQVRWPMTERQIEVAGNAIGVELAGRIVTLATMWAWGGSADWPVERIDATATEVIDWWHGLPGWEPGW